MTASGNFGPKPLILKPNFALVSNCVADRRKGTARTPSVTIALVSSRACQSNRSTASAMRSPAKLFAKAASTTEGLVQQRGIKLTGMKTFAGLERGYDHLGWTEQQRINRIKIAFELSEQLRKRPPEVARSRAGQTFGQALCFHRRSSDVKMHSARINDGVVGATHRG